MKWIYYFLIIVGIILMIFFVLSIIIKTKRKKKIYKLLYDNQFNEHKYTLIGVNKDGNKKKEYDYILKFDDLHIYIKYYFLPSNSQICINAKETWVLNYGGSKSNYGRVYPNKMFLDDLKYYLKNDMEGDDKALKVVLLYKSVEGIVMYLNESELAVVDIRMTPYNYKIMQYDHFEEELDYIVNNYKRRG